MSKYCSQCKTHKDESEFHKRVASADKLAFFCKPCVNINSKKWRDKNPDAHKNWYQKNKARKSEYFKLWRTADPEAEKQRLASWAKENPHKVNALISKRRAVKLRAIPCWVDHKKITEVYQRAAKLRKETGERYEVDHMVPLQSKYVCGLHWHGNLQIILKADNISKHNKRWPDMPSELQNAEN